MPRHAPRIVSGSKLPHRLRDLTNPPSELHLRGELPGGPGVALVGTRRPTPEGAAFARELGAALARAGVAVLSGGAEGIDTRAHEGALEAGGATVVVAPAGYRQPYPAENAGLFRRILAAGGAYVSLVPDDEPATRASFFPRNACLVALSHLVVVVEAPIRSGARNAASWARALGRPLYVVPAAPWNDRGRGCLVELKLGARLCAGPKDILAELDRMLLRPVPLAPDPESAASAQALLPFAAPRTGHMADADRVLQAVATGATHPDEVCDQTGLSPAIVQRQVLTLRLQGVLAPDPSAGLRLAPKVCVDPTDARQTSKITEETAGCSGGTACANVNKPET